MPAMAEPKRKKGGRPRVANPKKQAISLRASEEWRAWMNRLADHCGLPATILIAQALKDKAKAEGFEEPMPRR